MKIALLTTDSREHYKDYTNPQPHFGTAPEALLEGFKLFPDEVEIHVVSCLQQLPVSSPQKLANNIYYHPLYVPKWGWMRSIYFGCSRAVRRKLQEIQPDIVHGQGTERDCAISAIRSGFPNVITLHGVMRAIYALPGNFPFNFYWLARWLETIALKKTKGTIVISQRVAQLVSSFTAKTWFVPNAIRPLFFTPIISKATPNHLPHFINIGIITPNKRQVELLQKLITLRKDLAFNMTFLGRAAQGNPYSDSFFRLLAEANTKFSGFNHIPFLVNRELLAQLDQADAMIHFAKEESFGLIFAEALARNLTLFASEVGASREITESINNCCLFPPDDIEGLISSLHHWIESDEWLLQRENRPQEPNILIKRKYHPKEIAKLHLDVYKSILTTI